MITVRPITGLPEIRPGDPLPNLILNAVKALGLELDDSDILVVSQKIVSKAEGKIADLKSVSPSKFAETIAKLTGKDPRQVELILRESKRIIRMRGELLITETKHGFICANSGVDVSNLRDSDTVTVLPDDADESARKIRAAVKAETGRDLTVIISDTFGRPWRLGQVNFAIGVSGMKPLIDYRGTKDMHGYTLKVTEIAVADELAGAAELVMAKADGVPVALIAGYRPSRAEGTARDLIRPEEQDLFR